MSSRGKGQSRQCSNIYLLHTHAGPRDIKKVIESLPDYPWPGDIQSEALAATGTEGKSLPQENLASGLAFQAENVARLRTVVDRPNLSNGDKNAFLNGPARIRTLDQWIMSPLLYR